MEPEDSAMGDWLDSLPAGAIDVSRLGGTTREWIIPNKSARWPYGTIVENTRKTHTLMVVRDDGDTFVAMQLKDKFVIGGAGWVVSGWPKRLHVAIETP